MNRSQGLTNEVFVPKYYVRWPLNFLFKGGWIILLEEPILILLIISFFLSIMALSVWPWLLPQLVPILFCPKLVFPIFSPIFLGSDSASSVHVCLGLPFVLHPPGLPSSILSYNIPKPFQTVYFNYGYNIWRYFSPSLKKIEYECFSTVSFWMYCICKDGRSYSSHTESTPYSNCSVTWQYPAC